MFLKSRLKNPTDGKLRIFSRIALYSFKRKAQNSTVYFMFEPYDAAIWVQL